LRDEGQTQSASGVVATGFGGVTARSRAAEQFVVHPGSAVGDDDLERLVVPDDPDLHPRVARIAGIEGVVDEVPRDGDQLAR